MRFPIDKNQDNFDIFLDSRFLNVWKNSVEKVLRVLALCYMTSSREQKSRIFGLFRLAQKPRLGPVYTKRQVQRRDNSDDTSNSVLSENNRVTPEVFNESRIASVIAELSQR